MGYFLDDSGNFENFVKIWPPTPPNYYQNASKHTRKIMESSWKHIIFVKLGHQNFRKNRNLYVLGTRFVSCFFVLCLMLFRCRSEFLVVFWVYILKIILRRLGIENDTFSIIKQHPNLNMNFIFCKKHEMDFALNFLFSRNVP